MKQACIIPLMKKPSLDCTSLKNYQPVSTLTFLSKLVERVTAVRFHTYLANNNLYPHHQSVYRPSHSVESAFLHMSDNILHSLDSGFGVVVVFLDLSGTFDTIDYNILLETLHRQFGISGKGLN